MRIEKLTRDHDRKSFDCGNKELNNFLKQSARQAAERNLSRTFVQVDGAAPTTIIGYYTLTMCDVEPAEIPLKFAQTYPHPIPAARLVRVAVHEPLQGQGHGPNMLVHALTQVLDISQSVGLVGLFVDAKDQKAADWYMRYGFQPLSEPPLTRFMPLDTIRAALI